ncbi:glycosyltransferase [Virgibacillus flavescens]|uniref:glycosyltransferase n=1 Tax=Virgibacillus flavescens TaxID=1611422 RepID=UPI003D338B38
MNILIISHMYPSKTKEINGVFVHEQVKELIKQGHNVKVVSPVPFVPSLLKQLSPKWKNYDATPATDVIDTVEVHYPTFIALPKRINFHRSGQRMYHGIKKTVADIYKEFKFDVIHAHVALPDGAAAVQLAQDFNVPLITTIHGQDLQHTIHKDLKCRNQVTQVLTESSNTILVSHKLNTIRKKFFPEIEDGKCTVIHNGVAPLFLEPTKQPVSTTNQTDIKILCVANLLQPKGIDFSIKAMAKIVENYPNMTYQIIGVGPEADTLYRLVKKLGLENNVVFLGAKSREEVSRYMNESDIFLLPSWNEAFGVVYIEAMASGIPVIGCKGEGVEDIVDSGVDGYLVDPKDVDDIVRVTTELVANPTMRLEMGKAARIKVENNFTWEKSAAKLIDVYTKYVSDQRGEDIR